MDKSICHHPIIYNGRKIPLKDHSIDLVIVAFVLHHVNHQLELLKEIFRVSKKYVLIIEDTPSNSLQKVFNKFRISQYKIQKKSRFIVWSTRNRKNNISTCCSK